MTFPAQGIVGVAALREAAATEFRDMLELVERAVRNAIYPGNTDRYVDIQAMYPDRVIVRRDGRLYAYPYSLSDDNQVTIGTPSEVVQEHMPVALREALDVTLLEAQDAKGLRWRVRVIEAGESGNRNVYPDAVLREAAPLFENARVFVKSDEEHLKSKGKDFRNLIGRLSSATFIEGKATDTGEIQADLDLLESAGDVPAKLREAYERGMDKGLFGFSIDAEGRAKVMRGRRVAQSITKVNSVDLIIDPGAGGQLINLIESINPEVNADMSLRARMIEAVKKANKGTLPTGLDVDDDEALDTAYREALTDDKGDVKTLFRDELQESIRMVEARSNMRDAIANSGLPDIAKQKLRKQFDAMDQFKEAQVADAINDERNYLAKFTESGKVFGLGENLRIEGGEDQSEKVTKMLDAFFDKDNKDVISFKECYVSMTGDHRVTGALRDCDPVRMREALGDSPFREALDTTSLSVVIGDALNRRLIAEYNIQDPTDVWRLLTGPSVPVNDFRTQHVTRWGGYGDLPTVLEKGAYNPLTSPTDEEATYKLAKKGGTETISLEMIRNDDVGVIRNIPVKLSRAAKRTLSKFVLNFLRDNPTIYDTLTLFHATHNNLGALALSPSAFSAARLSIKQQTEKDSNERLGITGRLRLWVPDELEETAFDMFRRDTNNDETFVQTLKPLVVPVWYWTDANDWVVTTQPEDVPIVEIGFLDGNEEPELFVQDNPTSGSMFSNDQITYKLRHIYGGTAKEFRGSYKNVVI